MANDAISCPYCNTQVPMPESRVGSRVLCPRCGEMFPYRGAAAPSAPAITPASQPVPPNLAVATGAAEALPRRWSNGAVAGIVVAVMVAMLVASLTLAQLTVDLRRAHDFMRPERRPPITMPLVVLVGFLAYVSTLLVYLVRVLAPSRPQSTGARVGLRLLIAVLALIALLNLAFIGRKTSTLLGWTAATDAQRLAPDDASPPVRPVAPRELAALGFVPPQMNVIAGVHVAEAMKEPAGREFLTQARIRGSDLLVADIVKWTSLKLEDIDHLVLGLRVDESFPPALVLVVQTRQPYDVAAVHTALKAFPTTNRGQKILYRFFVEKLGMHLVLWGATPKTLVFALKPEDLDRVPETAASGVDHLPPELRTLLAERIPPGTQAWVAGHVERWKVLETLLTFPWLKLPRDELTFVTRVRTFAVWLQLGEAVSMNLLLDGVDPAAAEAVEKYLARRQPDDIDFFKVLGPRPETAAIARGLAHTLKHERHGTEVTIQATASAAIVQEALRGKR